MQSLAAAIDDAAYLHADKFDIDVINAESLALSFCIDYF
jgi:hypothetical protein